jgi:AraC-like DNA-binding protein
VQPGRSLNSPLLYAKPWLAALQPLLRQRGINTDELLRDLPPYYDGIKTADYRISHCQLQQLLGQVECQVNEPQIWQLIAETFCRSALNPLVDLSLQAASLADALRYSYRYRDLVIPNVILLPQQRPKELVVDIIPFSGSRNKMTTAARCASIKLTIALFVSIAKLRGDDLHHWCLHLPPDITPLPVWRKWQVQTHVREITRLVIPRQQLIQCRTVKPGQLKQARYFCQIQRQSLATPTQLERIFRYLLLRLNRSEDVSLSELSEVMGLSVSSCKRLFASFGQSYQIFYDQVRLYKLLDLLQQPGGTNRELAQKLGYSNPNNFRRACKRWLGLAPDELRQRLLG